MPLAAQVKNSLVLARVLSGDAGVNRTSVTVVAHTLQQAGIIKYSRGPGSPVWNLVLLCRLLRQHAYEPMRPRRLSKTIPISTGRFASSSTST